MFARGILSCGPGRMCSRPLALSLYPLTYIHMCRYICMHTQHTHVTHPYRGRAYMYAIIRCMCDSHRAAEDAGCFAASLSLSLGEIRYGTISAECLLSQQTTLVPFSDAVRCKNLRVRSTSLAEDKSDLTENHRLKD